MRLASLALLTSSIAALAAVEDFRYKVDVLAEGMSQPMELELAPDGRIFFNEIGGKLRILKQDTHQVVEAGTVKVTRGDKGSIPA